LIVKSIRFLLMLSKYKILVNWLFCLNYVSTERLSTNLLNYLHKLSAYTTCWIDNSYLLLESKLNHPWNKPPSNPNLQVSLYASSASSSGRTGPLKSSLETQLLCFLTDWELQKAFAIVGCFWYRVLLCFWLSLRGLVNCLFLPNKWLFG
jgi:hypothetical protein